MKKYIYYIMMASLLALVGCQQEELVNDNNTPVEGEKVILTANIAGSTQTRVALTPATDANNQPIIKVEWDQSGESFRVLSNSVSQNSYTTFTQIEGTNQFEGTLPNIASNESYIAIYGYDLQGQYNTLDAVFAEQDGTLDQDKLYMLAQFSDPSQPIQFQHTMAILKPTFTVDGNDINNTITEIKMGGIACPGGSGKLEGIETITITPSSSATALDKDIYIHLCVSGNDYSTFYSAGREFTFTVTAGGKNYTGSLIIPTGMSIEAGKLYTATVNLTQKESQPSEVILSQSGAANCYIISQAGSYKFSTVKGNSSESVGAVASAEVLWETFGTYVTPNKGDLVKNASYSDGHIAFQTADTFKEGNAVIAAKDADGNILWSWHIWLTDEPQGQVYYNNAGTMMDRNLGATSATPGDVGALGLLYQWGRKDPFLGSSSISSYTIAKSTLAWPAVVLSTSSEGTIAYATANPTTFIRYNYSGNKDWYYTGDSSTDNTRWTTSESNKSIYDPCPAGWRVPDSSINGVWSTALGSSSEIYVSYDGTNKGMNFSDKFGSDQTIWYPASGYRDYNDGSLSSVGRNGYYWSASPNDSKAYDLVLYISGPGNVLPSSSAFRAHGQSVRCLQESK